ncbi:MAG: aminotransferase class I/II-fold pyridoxal phosphate-dependent enzyme [Myxococcota bacterium]
MQEDGFIAHRSPLEIDGPRLQALLGMVSEKLSPFLDTLPDQPTMSAPAAATGHRPPEPCPEDGAPFESLLSELMGDIFPQGFNTASPGCMAYVPGGGLIHTAIADLLSGVVNRYTGMWVAAPGLVELESAVLRWMCGWVGYGPEAGGVLLSGGSMANLSAIIAARQQCSDWSQGVIYTAALTHHSVAKAAHIAGFRRVQVRQVAQDDRFRMCPEALNAAIAADRAAGRSPMMVVASAGSTTVGSVDPLRALATVCQEEGMWFHVDGAYGGCFALTDRGRDVLDGIALADSITLDPHKGLFLPYGTGCLLVRQRRHLHSAFSSDADYLPDAQDGGARWDFSSLGPELSRPARGLRLWLPLKMHGVSAFRDALDEKLDLTQDAATRIAALPGVRLVSEPALSLFTFRIEPPGATDEDADALTRQVLERINEPRRVWLSGSPVEEKGTVRFCIRVCVLSFRTHAEQIDILVDTVADAIRQG